MLRYAARPEVGMLWVLFWGSGQHIAIFFLRDFSPKPMVGFLLAMLVPCSLNSVATSELRGDDN